MSSKKIVLYQPQQVDEKLGPPSSRDMLPLEMLTIAAFPLRDGYEVVIIDGSLYPAEEGHRRAVEACEGALLYATTGILGYMVTDGFACSTKVKARHPKLPMCLGGWFGSVRPELQLATGLYDAVVLGQGESPSRTRAGGRLRRAARKLPASRCGATGRDRPKRAVAAGTRSSTCPGTYNIELPRHQLRADAATSCVCRRRPRSAAASLISASRISPATAVPSPARFAARRSSPTGAGRRCPPIGCSTT
jgi:hypothetical protein